MVTMWLPPPAALLAGHELNTSVLQADYRHPYLLTDLSTPLFNATAAAAAQTKPHNGDSSPRPLKKSFRCPYQGCTQTSSNKGNLSKHIATRHEHRKDFACPFKGCSRRFAKKYNMLRHLSASGVHRSAKTEAVKKGGRTRRPAKWSSMELDLARFLAMQCQVSVAGIRAM